jgi:hypothetical protein
MTAPNEDPDRLAAAGEAMTPEAVTQMEGRLLEAFSQHHSQAGRAGRPWARWAAIAAALAIVTAAGARWHGLNVPATPPQQIVHLAPAGPRAGGETVASISAPSRGPGVSAAPGGPTLSGGAPPKPRSRRPRVRSGRLDAPAVKPDAFIALPAAASLPTFESGSIVRMDLELSSLAAFGLDISAAGGRSPIQADFLVGQDGEPRAIRVVNTSWNSSIHSRSRQ